MKIKRNTLVKLKKWFLAIFVITLIGGAFKVYLEKDWFVIREYDLKGIDTEYQKDFLDRLKVISYGNLLFVFPKNKIASYDHKAIVELVSEFVPSRKEIIIRPNGLHTLLIEVKEYTPVLKISDNLGVTKDAIIFDTKRDMSSLPMLVSSSSLSEFKENGLPFKRFNSYDDGYIESLYDFSQKVSTMIFPVGKILVSEEKEISFLNKEGDSSISVSSDTDLKKAWSTLVSAVDTNPLKEKLEKKEEHLLYIDLRYGNKVFYKFGKGEFQNASSTDIINDHVESSTTPFSSQN